MGLSQKTMVGDDKLAKILQDVQPNQNPFLMPPQEKPYELLTDKKSVVTQKDFEDFKKKHAFVFVEFGSSWCGPCRGREKLITDAVSRSDGLGGYDVGFIIIDIDKSTDLTQRFVKQGLYDKNSVPHSLLIDTSEQSNEGVAQLEKWTTIPWTKENSQFYYLGVELTKLGVSRSNIRNSAELRKAEDGLKAAKANKDGFSTQIEDIGGLEIFIMAGKRKKEKPEMDIHVFAKITTGLMVNFDIHNLYLFLQNYTEWKTDSKH